MSSFPRKQRRYTDRKQEKFQFYKEFLICRIVTHICSMQNPTKCFNLHNILNSYFVLICICKLELDETGTGKIKYRKTLKHHKDIMNSSVLLIKRFSDEVVIVEIVKARELRVRFSLCLYLIILTILKISRTKNQSTHEMNE